MSVVITEQIWTFEHAYLGRREGDIILGEATLVNRTDTDKILTVESGLRPDDVIVFLGFTGLPEVEESFYETYLVTHVEEDGSGVMVADSFAQRVPREILTGRIRAISEAMLREEYAFEDFGVPWLDEAFRSP